MRILILDDDSIRHDMINFIPKSVEVWHAYDAERAIKLLDGDRFDLVLLDHDLGKDSDNGMAVARYIASMPVEKRPARVIVHSWNVDPAKSMADVLVKSGVWTRQVVFGPSMLEMLKALVQLEGN